MYCIISLYVVWVPTYIRTYVHAVIVITINVENGILILRIYGTAQFKLDTCIANSYLFTQVH